MSFSSFGLSNTLLNNIHNSGYTTPTEIQQKAIPVILKEHDMIGCAPTGTGKTAAFVLPIIHLMESTMERYGASPRALILSPTRELAQQIEDAVRTYGTDTTVRVLSVYGGVDIQRQLRILHEGTDILVATPGRLLDHLERGSVNLSWVEFLVLDEADRMYDMGFIHDVRRIIKKVPRQRQTLLFSATMPNEIRSLVAEILVDPVRIEVGQQHKPVDSITQEFYSVPKIAKLDLLVHILKTAEIESLLVFSRTKHGADRIARQIIQHGFRKTEAIHADRPQAQRDRALEAFKRRDVNILIATDVAARGLDIDKISHVINYDTPEFPEDYIHRIGRTGRASATGTAMTFVSRDEEKFLKRIGNLIGLKPEPVQYPDFFCSDLRTEAESSIAHAPRHERKYFRSVKF